MEFTLSATQKRQALEGADITLNTEIYSMLLRLGVDPETFVEADLDSLDGPGAAGEVLRLRQLLTSLSIVRAKLAELA